MSERRFLTVRGKRIEALFVGPPPGDAPTLVFLHEGLGSVSLWRDFPEALAGEVGLGALVYSRAGYGGSDPVSIPRPLSYMQDEARTMLAPTLEAAGVRAPILVGHSDGASIALVAAGSGAVPAVRALILEAPHVFVEDVSVASIAKAKIAYETGDLRERLRKHHGDNVDVAFRGWNRAWLDPGFRGWNIEEFLPGVRVPTLVVQGRDDEYGTTAQVDSIVRHAGVPAETLLLDACGHSPYRDQRTATLHVMADFLRRHGLARR